MRFLNWLLGKRRSIIPSQADGSSIESAIVVSDVALEYDYLARRFGRIHTDWELISQSLLESNDRYFDRMRVRTGEVEVDVFFDVTSTMGR